MSKKRRKRVLGKKLPPEVKERAIKAAEENERKKHARSEEKLRESLRKVGGPVEEGINVKSPFKPGGVITFPNTWTNPTPTTYTSTPKAYSITYDRNTS